MAKMVAIEDMNFKITCCKQNPKQAIIFIRERRIEYEYYGEKMVPIFTEKGGSCFARNNQS
jgi:hypothetical protein